MSERDKKQPLTIIKKYSDKLYLLFSSEADVALMFSEPVYSIGVCQNEDGDWGYWDYDPHTRRKMWVKVQIPDNVEDLNVTYGEQIQREQLIFNTYMTLCDQAFEKGYEPESKEFTDFVNIGMQLQFPSN